jgi:peroxiredoxin
VESAPKELQTAEILDQEGQAHRVAELWHDRPAVIMWVRHFGCLLCTAQVEEFKPQIQKLRDAGVSFAVIGTGAPNFVQGFKDRMELDVPVYSDEKKASYQALRMKRGLFTLLDPRVVFKNFLAPFKYRQRKTMGDPLQQGGVAVVRPDGTMPFKHISQFAGDHPKPEAVVAAALG